MSILTAHSLYSPMMFLCMRLDCYWAGQCKGEVVKGQLQGIVERVSE
jgi:hypothetical protein